MAKKIRQVQVENLSEDLSTLNNKRVTGVSFSGTTTKTLTVTFSDATTITGTFTDLNTTYPTLTEALLNTGTSTAASVVSAKVMADYINSRLSAVFTHKGTVANYGALPTVGMQVGDTYNVAAAFTQGAENYPAGTNVAWNGTSWDPLAGFVDTSIFLTAETDPKGVSAVSVTGGSTKTITITLRDATTITGTFADDNTTYAQGTLALLNTGTETVGKVWTAKDIADFVAGKQVTVKHELTTVTAGMISGGNVTIPLTGTFSDKFRVLAFLNGVKQPVAAQTKSGSNLVFANASLPTPIIATDEIELYYI
ncbi:hypothetical protein [Chryseobacterium sp. MFBS3-17]|uniref:hypothetical protein n=1 Tax=Chryseobacterium sp. MFBS3-17 TaxID=2886689 RepID=UPI001D0EB58C|nr:hypothetical protein [Chryseobacterium sp. MFBS3-17]MCC2590372.1 hypothetical protein [Chryseobacterium sp. MFBS3-17]